VITLQAYSPSAVDLTPAEASLYGQMDRVRQATNAGIRRWVIQWRELLQGRVLDYGAGKPGTCRIPQPFRELIGAAKYVPWEPGDETVLADESFDAILCTQAVQNCEDPLEVFNECFYDLLKPGGHLVLTYPGAWEEIEQEFWRFTQHGLWLLCHKSGLKIVQHEPLVQLAVDGSIRLNLVNGLVARKC